MRQSKTFKQKGAMRNATAAALLLSFLVVACDSPTAADVDEPGPQSPRITEVKGLTPGGSATIVGYAIQDISSVTIDGQTVDFTPISATEGTFSVPELNSCEVDGRKVEIVTNTGLRSNSRMDVSSTLRLEIGESRILSAEDLACLQVGRGMESYVMTVANFDTEAGPNSSPFRMYVRGTANTAPVSAAAAVASQMGLSDPHHGHSHEHQGVVLEAMAGSDPLNPPSEGPFDDYANAQVGDTLTFVDWNRFAEVINADEKEDVPTYKGVVVAIEGTQMVVAHMGSAGARQFTTNPDLRAKAAAAARISSDYTLPTLRHLISPDLQVAQEGAGGRMIAMIEDLTVSGAAGIAYSTELNTHNMRWTSGFFLSRLNAQNMINGSAESMARIMLHENGHLGEAVTERVDRYIARTSAGWHSEAFAVTVEDVAARLYLAGRVTGVERPSNANPMHGMNTVLHSAGDLSPWGTETGGRTQGWYGRGARILRYAQSLLPEDEVWEMHAAAIQKEVESPESPVRASFWSLDAVAEYVGKTPQELLEESMLADVTDQFVSDQVAADQGLPRVRGWTGAGEASDVDSWIRSPVRGEHRFDRNRDYDLNLSVPRGGYQMRFIAGEQHRGISFEMKEGNLSNKDQVRITRIR